MKESINTVWSVLWRSVQLISEKIVQILKDLGVNLFATLPCEKTRPLSELISANFQYITLTREEEGAGISAGAYLAGAKPVMLVQSSGIGNMINALCSLTKAYRLPLLIFVSWRGAYKEKIPAQVPLGKRLLRILASIDVDYSLVENPEDLDDVPKFAAEVYAGNSIGAILLTPKIWGEEKTEDLTIKPITRTERECPQHKKRIFKPTLTRFEILQTIAPYLDRKIIVCNLGIPCKELYQVKHQKSNFYMLGSMGLASSIGLGIASFTRKDVVVIDGDGSLLMNLGTLSTIGVAKPKNLTILAVDNGVHGSTGNQPTATSRGADLELIAKGSCFDKTYKVASKDEIHSALENLGRGPNFVHIIAKSGNANVPNIPLTLMEIKRNVMEALKE
jgi:sulfopyruvate decarboxylase beta subunit